MKRIALFLACGLLATAQALKPGPPAIVTIQTRDLQVEFAGDRAWTIFRILHAGEVIADKNGFYGTVFAEEGGKWIGTGHNEGGVEKVLQTTLTVDGRPCELTDKASYKGQRAVIEKRSIIGPLNLQATYIVTDDAVLERHRYEVTADVKIGTLYAFMHAWLPRTIEWIAQMPDGTLKEGKFDNSGDFKLKDDPKWTALYDPGSKRVALAWYPQPLAGQGIKTGYWDKTVYHKLYNQLYSHAEVKKGLKFETAVIVRSVASDASTWKDAAKALATNTAAEVSSGALGFK
jgi:hypothetical protein